MGLNKHSHFWWSEKAEKHSQKMLPRKDHRNYCIIGDKEVEYSLWTDTEEHGSGWDDIEYLGYGIYSHSRKARP